MTDYEMFSTLLDSELQSKILLLLSEGKNVQEIVDILLSTESQQGANNDKV